MFKISKSISPALTKKLAPIFHHHLFQPFSSLAKASLRTQLPLLNHLVDITKKDSKLVKMAPKTALIAVRHGLKTEGGLLRASLELKMKLQNIYFITKKYMPVGYKERGKHMLDPKGQMEIYKQWRKLVPDYPFSQETLEKFSSVESIRYYSGGIHYPIDVFPKERLSSSLSIH